MGDEFSIRTKGGLRGGPGRIIASSTRASRRRKRKTTSSPASPAIVEAIRSARSTAASIRKDKFHAKAYITHARLEVVGSSALVGSSNFTYPGLTENIELNVQITGAPVTVLQEWYEQHWDEAEDVTPEILRVIERHVREYSPFEVYAQSLHELFAGYQQTATEWESGTGDRKSAMFRKLDQLPAGRLPPAAEDRQPLPRRLPLRRRRPRQDVRRPDAHRVARPLRSANASRCSCPRPAATPSGRRRSRDYCPTFGDAYSPAW